MDERFIILKEYLKNKNCLNDKFGVYSRLYKMTTENIKEVVDTIDCKDKSVLTVTGSGDQALNTILNGARNITCFDINPFTFYHLKLKTEAIKTLSFYEFLDFFDIYNPNLKYTFLDKELYLSFKNKLDLETRLFFDTLYEVYGNDCFKILKNIYYRFTSTRTHIEKMSNYMNEDRYYLLSDILKHETINIDFIHSDFIHLDKHIGNKKFDVVLLSNICEYLDWMYSDNYLENYYNYIINISNNLNNNGIIQVGYTVTRPDIVLFVSTFSNREERNKVFSNGMLEELKVTSFNDSEPYQYTDSVFIYKKK